MESTRPTTPDAALRALFAGNERFATGRLRSRDHEAERAAVVELQEPFAAVLACSDSRVPAETVFDVGIGEAFVVRTAGGVVGDVSLASLRFAVEVLGVSLVVVLGHEDCGAIKASISEDAPEWLGPVLEQIRSDVRSEGGCGGDLNCAIEAHVRETAARLAEVFAGHEPRPLAIPAVYELATGRVRRVD